MQLGLRGGVFGEVYAGGVADFGSAHDSWRWGSREGIGERGYRETGRWKKRERSREKKNKEIIVKDKLLYFYEYLTIPTRSGEGSYIFMTNRL